MAGIIDTVDLRTQMVGENRLELLLFHLGGKQLYGINVFKVQEVIQCPDLTMLPNSAPAVRGIVNMRGKTISIIDLRMALGGTMMEDPKKGYVIVTEFNRRVQGLLVSGVDRIINLNWTDIMSPPQGMGNVSYMTAVTRIDNKLVEVIDVEKVLSDIIGVRSEVSQDIVDSKGDAGSFHVLVVDDSVVARNQIKRTLEQIGLGVTLANNGAEGLKKLQELAAEHGDISQAVSLLISDIEMPQMDGYTLTSEVRKDPALKDLYIILHTSLSGVFNETMVKKVGADRFLPKFHADELAKLVLEIKDGMKKHAASRT